jgi:Kef-type K+ transport system membrane component KefB
VTKGAEVLLFLLLDLTIIIIAARSCGAVARRIGQPAVIGEIVAGLLLGPSVLGRFLPAVPAALFPSEVPLAELANLGLVFFMFLVGLELDTRLIRQEGSRALAISFSGILAPFVLGAGIAIPLLPLNNAGTFVGAAAAPPATLPFVLFMGTAMCITAFPVLARILVERGLYRSPMGTTALCAAAVDDVTAWILLAAVVGITRTGSASEAVIVLTLAGLFAVFMVVVGRRLLALLAGRCEATGHLTVDQVAVVVVCLFLCAAATERIGIHAIFGAFVFGATMPQGSIMTRELTDKLEDLTVVVLLPAFFVVTGLRTNLLLLGRPELFAWTLLIVGAATAGKLGGCTLAARATGYSMRDSLALGTLMNTRGLTELVILSIGLGLGVLSDRTFAMMIVMALVTTFMAAPIVNRIMPRREMVRVLAGGDPPPMAARVLVAIGNPENARALVGAGIALTGSARPAELLLVRLIATPRAPEFRTGLKDEESQIDRSRDALNRLVLQAAEAGVAARAISFLSDDVGRDLALVAATQRCDAVLLGWHRASLERHVVRALIHRVFEAAPCAAVVFVDRHGNGLPTGGLPIAVAGSADGTEAVVLDIARRLAETFGSRVDLVPIPEAIAHTGAGGVLGTDAAALQQAARASGAAAAVVMPCGRVVSADAEFGQPATAFATLADCPVLVVNTPPGLSVKADVDRT